MAHGVYLPFHIPCVLRVQVDTFGRDHDVEYLAWIRNVDVFFRSAKAHLILVVEEARTVVVDVLTWLSPTRCSGDAV